MVDLTKSDDHILFVFGMARSGTTYLNGVLDEWFGYGMGPEGTFINEFAKKLPRYGSLSNEKVLRSLVEDVSRCQMLEIIRKRWAPENRFDVSPDEIWKRLRGTTYSDVVEAVLRAVADFQNKPRLGNKDPGYWTCLPLLESLFSNRARSMCIIRDGRDVYISLQRLRWGGHSPYQTAKLWRKMSQKTREFFSAIGKDRFLFIPYEDLLSDPEHVVGRIELFLEFPLTPTVRDALLA